MIMVMLLNLGQQHTSGTDENDNIENVENTNKKIRCCIIENKGNYQKDIKYPSKVSSEI